MTVTVVVHPFHGPGLVDELEQVVSGARLVVPDDADGVADAVAEGADGLVTYEWEDRFAVVGLRWVQSLSAGIEQFPADLLASRGIILTSARGVHAPSVAEHAMALLLAVVRGIPPVARDATVRRWKPKRAYEVSGRTMAVLGLGSIGEEIARRGAALGMRVIGTKRDPESYEGVADAVYRPDATLEVCRQADAVVVALPEDESTRGLIGAAELAALGAGWLVNVGRGSVLDEDALVHAVEEGTLLGAGLDVVAEEPLPEDSPLWDLTGVLVTPHMAWSSDRLAGRMAALVAANVDALRGESEWRNRVV